MRACVHIRSCSCFSGSVKVDLMSSEAAHQIGGQQRLKVQEQPSAGDLLQPAPAGFLGLRKVLGVRAVRARLPACTVELKAETEIWVMPVITWLQFDDWSLFTWLRTASRCSEKAQTAATRDWLSTMSLLSWISESGGRPAKKRIQIRGVKLKRHKWVPFTNYSFLGWVRSCGEF